MQTHLNCPGVADVRVELLRSGGDGRHCSGTDGESAEANNGVRACVWECSMCVKRWRTQGSRKPDNVELELARVDR